jgi:hypothetical protein
VGVGDRRSREERQNGTPNALFSLLVSEMRLSASLAAFIGEKQDIFFDFGSDPLGILDNLVLMTFVITFERYFC